MPDARDTQGTVFVGGTAAMLARVLGMTAQPIVQADLSSIAYSIFALDDTDATARTPVTGHSAVVLTVSNVIFNTLQTDAVWTTDTIGYNFLHVIDITTHPAFTLAQQRYLVEYKLTPTSGQPILVRFLINVI
jgi:hypothetical protein